jgi:hypothetical protein
MVRVIRVVKNVKWLKSLRHLEPWEADKVVPHKGEVGAKN